MFRHTAIAVAILATLAGCAGGPFEGLLQPRAADHVEGKPESGKVNALIRVADATAAAGDMASAIQMYRNAHKIDPLNSMVTERLGEALLRVGEFDDAVEVFGKAVRGEGKPSARIGMAKALIALNQPQAAITHLEAALKVSESPRVYNAMGVAYDLIGDHGAAQAHYRTGLDISAGNLSLQNNLGLSLSVSGRHDEAIRVLRKSASSPRAQPRNRLNLALAYGMAGETEAAAETARFDLNEAAVQQNLAFYATLRSLNDSRQTIRAIGAHNAGLSAMVAPRLQSKAIHN
jgi:Flp pilus assembly protein TadD